VTDDEVTAVLGFGSVAALTFAFSYFPRLFIKIFVPREDLRHAVRHILRDPNFGWGMRLMAGLQFAAGLLWVGVVRLARN
jgi:hypothetical protein